MKPTQIVVPRELVIEILRTFNDLWFDFDAKTGEITTNADVMEAAFALSKILRQADTGA